ncbi:hypothetical protein KJ966_23960 [bacterium]|nr:hypothetical protein [bacterium]
MILRDYIARYLILQETIHILRIWHKKEDWKWEMGSDQAKS